MNQIKQYHTELALAAQAGDAAAREQLLIESRAMCRAEANRHRRKLRNGAIDIEDLTSAAQTSLIRDALPRYDGRAAWASYAYHWIRKAVHAELELRYCARVPAPRLAAFARTNAGLPADYLRPATALAIHGVVTSCHMEDLTAEHDDHDFTPEQFAENPWGFLTAPSAEDWRRWLELLTPRQQFILRYRYGLAGCRRATLAEIGDQLGLSKEAIRQAELVALRRLKKIMEDDPC